MLRAPKRLCLSLEPMMDEESMLPASAAPVYRHQRGRRRSPAPVPPPHARYGSSAMLFSLAMTSATPAHPAPMPRHARAPRQQTPSGGNGTFRGRRRHRSPSLSMTSAIRKASARPHTPSRSSSLLKAASQSRPTSPLSPGARSRGRPARGESASPRRMILCATVDMDHSVYAHSHQHHYPTHAHHHAHLHPFSVKRARRAHCPSRSGSADGAESRRRPRTRSRPRHTGDPVSAVSLMSSHPSNRSPARLASDGDVGMAAATATPGHTRRQFHMLFADASGANSDGDAMEIEHWTG